MYRKIGIIGVGVVGTAVGVVLNDRGYEITGIFDINPESTKRLEPRARMVATSAQEVSRRADILFITTNDSSIGPVVEELTANGAFHTGQVVVHMSGAQSSEYLDDAKNFGAKVLSVHPLQSFADIEGAIENMPGSTFSIEGDKEAYDIAVDIVETLSGEYFFIDRWAKPLYHAGACVVSNYLVTLIDLGVKLLESTGMPKSMATKALLPLIRGTVHNVEKIGIPKALTGPIARGDVATIIKHLDSLAEATPDLMTLYSWLGFYTTKIAEEKGTLNQEQGTKLQDVFAEVLSKTVYSEANGYR